MSNSYNSYTGNGVTQSYAITFQYLKEEHVYAFLDGVSTTDWSIVGSDLVFTTAPADQSEVLIIRQTPRALSEQETQFESASILTEEQLDNLQKQLLFICQEAFEQSETGDVVSTIDTLTYSTSLSGYDAGNKKIVRLATPESNTDAVNKQYVDDGFVSKGATIDAEGLRITNLADPVLGSDAVDRDYVDNYVTFGASAVPEVFSTTTIAATNVYTLTNVPNAIQDMSLVTLDGVVQIPGVDFQINAGDPDSSLVFLGTPPEAGLTIHVQVFGAQRYQAIDAIADGSVTTSKLADGSVTPSKLSADAVEASALATDSVTSDALSAGSVGESELGGSSVSTAKLQDDAVTEDKLADGSVSLPKLKTAFTSAPATATDPALIVDKDTGNISLRTIVSDDISDLNATIEAKRLDEFAAPTSNVDLGSQKIINLADPTADTDAATQGWVNAQIGVSNQNLGPFFTDGYTAPGPVDVIEDLSSIAAFTDSSNDSVELQIRLTGFTGSPGVDFNRNDIALGLQFYDGSSLINNVYQPGFSQSYDFFPVFSSVLNPNGQLTTNLAETQKFFTIRLFGTADAGTKVHAKCDKLSSYNSSYYTIDSVLHEFMFPSVGQVTGVRLKVFVTNNTSWNPTNLFDFETGTYIRAFKYNNPS